VGAGGAATLRRRWTGSEVQGLLFMGLGCDELTLPRSNQLVDKQNFFIKCIG